MPPPADSRREYDPVGHDPAVSRREYGLMLAVGAAGAVLILLALREVWAHAVYTPPHPIPKQDYAVTGQSLIPLASALAIAALACLAAVIATRGRARRVVGALLAVIGGYAAVTVTAAVTAAAVLATAQNANPATGAGTGGGSTTSGASSAAPTGILVSRHTPGARGHDRPGLARGSGHRGAGDRAGRAGYPLARIELAGDVGPVRTAGPAGRDETGGQGRLGNDVGVAQPGCGPYRRF